MKKKKKRLLIDYEQLSTEDVVATVKEMMVRLQGLFRHHIGSENSVSPVQVFERVMGINPESISIYRREYWWNIIKRIMRHLRSSEEVFIICRGQRWFVLQSEEELKRYKKGVRHSIKSLEGMMTKAERWVTQKNWRNI